MNTIKTIHILMLPLLLTSISTITLAKTYTADDIEEFTHAFVEKNTPIPTEGKRKISVNKLDPRIQIPSCDKDIKANIPEKNNSRNVNVKVYCDGTTRWQLYVPVKIKTVLPVLVSKRNISKGSILDESNTEIIYKDLHKIRGEIISNVKVVKGTKATKNITKNKAITKRNICFVCKGERVTIIAKSDTFNIRTQGTALSNGALGDDISIKNSRSGRTISAQVKAVNQVVINL